MKKNIIMLAVVSVLGLGSSVGCGAIIGALPAVISTVTKALLVLDEIERFTNMFFMAAKGSAAADPTKLKQLEEQEKNIGKAIGKARTAALGLQHAAEGAQYASDEQVIQAFQKFEQAYMELTQLTGPLGVKVAPVGGLMVSGEGTLTVPPAEEFRPKEKQ